MTLFVPKLNQDQKSIYDQILQTITFVKTLIKLFKSDKLLLDYQIENDYFVNGLGGAGITFL